MALKGNRKIDPRRSHPKILKMRNRDRELLSFPEDLKVQTKGGNRLE
jgi:hypothetical protein